MSPRKAKTGRLVTGPVIATPRLLERPEVRTGEGPVAVLQAIGRGAEDMVESRNRVVAGKGRLGDGDPGLESAQGHGVVGPVAVG